ncbi:hypothetical protein P171DRAFT_516149 [Karstenula rhodostoma CBS 690.94]|uniref:Uncharacterized protein n=1 Tax=Karstenula rhodostoma CBS 690.94 TaxID=1392251 RepID=A0A9P4PRY2_9PLEO|nr:hypothetical protein P171DRAFT_516149 [Karstenula rhodostoma CBS 690.94]
MKLVLWLVLAFLALCLAFQDHIQYDHAVHGDLHGTNVTRRWNDPPPGIAPEEVMQKARCKGQNLYGAFFEPDGHLAFGMAKQWQLPDALAWGYKINYYIDDVDRRNLGAKGLPESLYGIARALTALGKSDKDRQDGGRLTICDVHHFDQLLLSGPHSIGRDYQTYTLPMNHAPPRVRRVTGSMSTWGYSNRDGVIINMDIKSSATAAKERVPPVPDDQLPELRTLSDLQWVIWEADARKAVPQIPVNTLEWYFVASIINEETRQLIRFALFMANNNAEEPLQPWPGRWIPTTEIPGLVLLGSPLGKTLGYFLIQHKPQLGNMWVDGVRVFHGDTSHKAACLAFHIRQPAPRPPDSGISQI